MENKNMVATIMRYGSIALFVIAILVTSSNSMIPTIGEFSSDRVFNAELFFSALLVPTILCFIVFGLSELIQICHDSRYELAITTENKENK